MVELAYKKDPKAFFRLPVRPMPVGQLAFLGLLSQPGIVEKVSYASSRLESGYPPNRQRVSKKSFVNVDFSSTVIHRFEFRNCLFSDSLFQGTCFSDCRFDGCSFVRCNTNRIEFDKVYINPESFDKCLNRFYHANLGVYLFQQLLANSKREFQTDFEFAARFRFGVWSRYQNQFNNDFTLWTKGSIQRKSSLTWQIFSSRVFQYTMGFGVKWQHFAFTSFSLIGILSFVNFNLRTYFGLAGVKTPVDAVYFTVITLSTVGFGDIFPGLELGKIAIAAEGLIGVFIFAALTSMLLKRLTG